MLQHESDKHNGRLSLPRFYSKFSPTSDSVLICYLIKSEVIKMKLKKNWIWVSLDTHPSDILLVSWLKSSWRLLRSAEIYFQDLKNCFEVNIGAWDQMKQHQSVVHHKISWNKRPKKCFLFCSSLRWGSHAIRTQPQLLMNSLDDVPEKMKN